MYSSDSKVTVGGQKYLVEKRDYDEYGEKGTVINFYLLPKNQNQKSVLNFLLAEKFGSCSKRNYENSTYTIDGSNVYVYTKWHGYSLNGYRKMVFKLNGNKSKKLSSEFYINSRTQYDNQSGVYYLVHAPKTSEEKKFLNQYISSIEQQYKGKFLLGDKATKLSKEVEDAFLKSIQNRWGS